MRKQVSTSNFHPDKIRLLNNRLLGRASSVFFLGLLDGHPQIVTLPYLTVAYRFLDFKGRDAPGIAENLWRLLEKSYARVSGGEKPPYLQTDFVAHVRDYLDQFGISRKTVFISLFFGYAAVSNPEWALVRYINHNEHEVLGELMLERDFPQRNSIYLIRDPRASFASIKRVRDLNPIESETLFSTLYKHAYKRALALGRQDVLLLRHEDIHRDYPSVMKRYCDFLSIPFHPALEGSSFFGIPYTGENFKCRSTIQLYSSRPDPRYVNDGWKSELSRSEFRLVQRMSADIIAEQGYERMTCADLVKIAPTFDYLDLFARHAPAGSFRRRLLLGLRRIPGLGTLSEWGLQAAVMATVYGVARLRLLVYG